MSIYTKIGDRGTTSSGNALKEKDDILIECLGTLDELVSLLGITRTHITDIPVNNNILNIQRKLFIIGAELSQNNKQGIDPKDVKWLESIIDNTMKDHVIENFIVPGNNKESSYLHMSRALTRRLERRLASLKRTNNFNILILEFINRLSDVFFAMAIDLE
ncbi:cob(I)yrinic acid a,c-diamide adenosyltransferase [Serpentinicella sp. ANB-PHB4]|uniref:cob(I)yrinic acid a,c-diamide adenosyltransferase n=1 Tax=Serpentinicella sp. ANB-PHB4 TaxID=3074076 RepID=UPI00285CD9E5|nr:cob(I)yrinic acid a,c-diamide adenosyltransferase [Serpentinicella sp. ANB-PHB4]MDR5658013.1 cob(I)yrinic acid a,c-diamide adenosyltransferase [Serpentinicella sp. ANB-PHB4]